MFVQTHRIASNLVNSRLRTSFIDLGDTRITVNVTVESKQEIASTKIDRFASVAKEVIKEYQDIITSEVEKLEGKVKQLAYRGDFDASVDAAMATSTTVDNAVRSLQGAVDQAIKARVDREARDDRNLKEARIATVLQAGRQLVSIANDAFALAASGGAGVKLWYDLAKDIYGFAMTIQNAMKDEPKLREDLLGAAGAYFTDKQQRIIDKQNAEKGVKGVVVLAVKDFYRLYKSKADEAEKARKKYRNHVTKMRQDVDKMSRCASELERGIARGGRTKKHNEVSRKLKTLSKKISAVNAAFRKNEGFADDMAFLLTEAGVDVDDRTTLEKLKEPKVLLSTAKSIYDDAKGIYELVKNIRDAVA